MSPQASPLVQHRHADLARVRIHYVEAGEGPLVLLLHGFPEHWYSWRHQLPALAAAGFHAVAPDMRGYGESDKPTRTSAYSIDELTSDAAQLIERLGGGRAAVAGHDWGGMVAWALAMRRPDLVERLVILNAPHPVRFARGLLSPRQLARSWYIGFFQLPLLPELALSARRHSAIRRVLEKEPVRPDAFLPEEVERYVDATAIPGALRGGIAYYRAVFRNPLPALRTLRRIESPTLVIWGDQDRHLGSELARPSERWVPHCTVEHLPDASHWVQSDRPERVNQLLTQFLAPLKAAA